MKHRAVGTEPSGFGTDAASASSMASRSAPFRSGSVTELGSSSVRLATVGEHSTRSAASCFGRSFTSVCSKTNCFVALSGPTSRAR